MDNTKCNFNANVTRDDGSCKIADCNGTCGGKAVEDVCGVCLGDGKSCIGCMTETACNYNSTATVDDGLCLVNDCEGTCGGKLVNDACSVCGGNGSSCTLGCMNNTKCNYNENATVDDGSCKVADCEGTCGGSAALDVCNVCAGNGTSCIGCMTETACNYNSTATVDDGLCLVNDCNSTCGGKVVNDACSVCGGDGTSCTLGCMTDTKCNYNKDATVDDGSC
jgi:hypothetical protein